MLTDQRPRIDLMTAANISGFCLFPVGWAWLECSIRSGRDTFPFYESAEQLGRLAVLPSRKGTIPTDGKSNRQGQKAFKRGILVRRKYIESFLANVIAKGKIPAYIYSDRDPFAVRRLPVEMRLRRDFMVDLRKNICSLKSAGPEFQWSFDTDPSKLVGVLNKQARWRRRASHIDWFLFERIAREIVEARGYPETIETLYRSSCEVLAQHFPLAQEPNRSEGHKLLSRLRGEYVESEI